MAVRNPTSTTMSGAAAYVAGPIDANELTAEKVYRLNRYGRASCYDVVLARPLQGDVVMRDVGQDRVRSKHRLKQEVKQRVTQMFSSILDYSEVAIGDAGRYKALRAKILTVSNDAIREIERVIDTDYTVEFIPTNDVVVVKPR